MISVRYPPTGVHTKGVRDKGLATRRRPRNTVGRERKGGTNLGLVEGEKEALGSHPGELFARRRAVELQAVGGCGGRRRRLRLLPDGAADHDMSHLSNGVSVSLVIHDTHRDTKAHLPDSSADDGAPVGGNAEGALHGHGEALSAGAEGHGGAIGEPREGRGPRAGFERGVISH